MLSESADTGRLGNSVIAVQPAVRRRSLDPEAGRLVVEIDEFIDGAAVLTDDFAPVDQLLTPAS